MEKKIVPLNLGLHPKQKIAFETKATELLYGGSAGGGKSHLMRVDSIVNSYKYPQLQSYLFRRLSVDLKKNHLYGPTGYHAMLEPWTKKGLARIVDDQIRFFNGSIIHLCHCEHEKDVTKYQGADIHRLYFDELTHFTEYQYRYLRGRLRAPKSIANYTPVIRAGANPGGVGHGWVKKTFIDGAEPFKIREMPDDEGGMLRQFIPANLEDNPSLNKRTYEKSLLGLGSPALVEALRWGNWDINADSYFPEFGLRHIVAPFEIPEWWVRCRSFDWGSASPFSVGWWAVSDGTVGNIPKGALIRYREWYGAKGDKHEGLRLTVEEIADGILARDQKENIDFSVADTAIFTEDGGPSIAERFSDKGVYWSRADKSRLAGWDELRQRLKGIDGVPMIYFFSTCRDSIRTIPLMISDENRPEDINTDLEDHAMDEIRYMCMARPMVRKAPEEAAPVAGIAEMTVQQIFEMHERIKSSTVNYY